jgi:hypothetical protein
VNRSVEPFAIRVGFKGAVVDAGTVSVGKSVEIIEASTGPVLIDDSWLPDNRLQLAARRGAFPSGSYLVRLHGDPPAITSLAGHALDGEAGQKWPSGDGIPGGNCELRFTVT